MTKASSETERHGKTGGGPRADAAVPRSQAADTHAGEASAERSERASSDDARDDEARAFLARCRTEIDARLEELVPPATLEPITVHGAMRWSLFAGGKRFRPALLLACGETFGASRRDLLTAACAFELVHTYSLIHDDLPAMDDDDLRRGRPTCHVQFGEATAILAGDALQAMAFQLIAEDEPLSTSVRLRLVSELARAAGTPAGMVAGQAHDLSAEARDDVTGGELDLIHQRKTGAMIAAAARSGAIIAGARPEELEGLTSYALKLGLLFQITDDLLDVTASISDLGKTPGKDARARKATYPSLYGLESAAERAHLIHREACEALGPIGRETSLLEAVARLVLNRRA